jgi:hypothetical protein
MEILKMGKRNSRKDFIYLYILLILLNLAIYVLIMDYNKKDFSSFDNNNQIEANQLNVIGEKNGIGGTDFDVDYQYRIWANSTTGYNPLDISLNDHNSTFSVDNTHPLALSDYQRWNTTELNGVINNIKPNFFNSWMIENETYHNVGGVGSEDQWTRTIVPISTTIEDALTINDDYNSYYYNLIMLEDTPLSPKVDTHNYDYFIYNISQLSSSTKVDFDLAYNLTLGTDYNNAMRPQEVWIVIQINVPFSNGSWSNTWKTLYNSGQMNWWPYFGYTTSRNYTIHNDTNLKIDDYKNSSKCVKIKVHTHIVGITYLGIDWWCRTEIDFNMLKFVLDENEVIYPKEIGLKIENKEFEVNKTIFNYTNLAKMPENNRSTIFDISTNLIGYNFTLIPNKMRGYGEIGTVSNRWWINSSQNPVWKLTSNREAISVNSDYFKLDRIMFPKALDWSDYGAFLDNGSIISTVDKNDHIEIYPSPKINLNMLNLREFEIYFTAPNYINSTGTYIPTLGKYQFNPKYELNTNKFLTGDIISHKCNISLTDYNKTLSVMEYNITNDGYKRSLLENFYWNDSDFSVYRGVNDLFINQPTGKYNTTWLWMDKNSTFGGPMKLGYFSDYVIHINEYDFYDHNIEYNSTHVNVSVKFDKNLSYYTNDYEICGAYLDNSSISDSLTLTQPNIWTNNIILENIEVNSQILSKNQPTNLNLTFNNTFNGAGIKTLYLNYLKLVPNSYHNDSYYIYTTNFSKFYNYKTKNYEAYNISFNPNEVIKIGINITLNNESNIPLRFGNYKIDFEMKEKDGITKNSYLNGTFIHGINISGKIHEVINYSNYLNTSATQLDFIFDKKDGDNVIFLTIYDKYFISMYEEYIILANPPTIKLESPENQSVILPNTLINYTITGSYLNHSWYLINGTNKTDIFDPYEINTSSWEDGLYQIDIYANDTFGNIANICSEFTIDSIVPFITLVHPQNNSRINSGTGIYFNIADPHLNLSWYYINNTKPAEILTSPFDINTTNWTDGLYRIDLYSNDTINNTNHQYYEFIIDDTAPSINLIEPLNKSWIIPGTQINLSISDINLDTCWYYINMTNMEILPSPFRINTTDWIDGFYKITIYTNDTINNINMSYYEFHIDNTEPLIELFELNNKSIIRSGISIKFNISDPILNTSWYLINGSYYSDILTYPFEINTSSWTNGLYNLRIKANDSLNNIAEVLYSISIDNTLLILKIESPVNNSRIKSGTLINFSSHYNFDHGWYYINETKNGYPIPESLIINTSGWEEGFYELNIYANDSVNNKQGMYIEFIIDNTPPEIIINSPQNITYKSQQITINFSKVSTDIHMIYYSIFCNSSQQWINQSILWTSEINLNLPNGKYTIFISINDTAGNKIEMKNSFELAYSPPSGFDENLIWIIIIIVIGSVVGISSYFIVSRRKSKKTVAKKKKSPEIAQHFETLKNLLYLLIIHKNTGLCIFSQKFIEIELDPSLISGFLTAINSFRSEIVSSSNGTVDLEGKNFEIDYGSFRILYVEGNFVNVALILTEQANEYLKSMLNDLTSKYEMKFERILIEWTGEAEKINIIKSETEQLITTIFKLDEYYEILKRKQMEIEERYENTIMSHNKSLQNLIEQIFDTKRIEKLTIELKNMTLINQLIFTDEIINTSENERLHILESKIKDLGKNFKEINNQFDKLDNLMNQKAFSESFKLAKEVRNSNITLGNPNLMDRSIEKIQEILNRIRTADMELYNKIIDEYGKEIKNYLDTLNELEKADNYRDIAHTCQILESLYIELSDYESANRIKNIRIQYEIFLGIRPQEE